MAKESGINCSRAKYWIYVLSNKSCYIIRRKKLLELIKNGKIDLVKTNDYILDHTQRVNINCISWFGKEFAKFNGTVGIEEEEWLSRTAPKEFNKNNAICGNSVVAHYGFRTQKKFLDKTNVLNEYKKLMSINIKLN